MRCWLRSEALPRWLLSPACRLDEALKAAAEAAWPPQIMAVVRKARRHVAAQVSLLGPLAFVVDRILSACNFSIDAVTERTVD